MTLYANDQYFEAKLQLRPDNKEILDNIYGKEKGEYGASKPSRIITKHLDNKFFNKTRITHLGTTR